MLWVQHKVRSTSCRLLLPVLREFHSRGCRSPVLLLRPTSAAPTACADQLWSTGCVAQLYCRQSSKMQQLYAATELTDVVVPAGAVQFR